MRIKDLDNMDIETIIRLPFFHSLEQDRGDPKSVSGDQKYWKIKFRCTRILGDGSYQLLDQIFDNEFVVKYKIMEFKP